MRRIRIPRMQGCVREGGVLGVIAKEAGEREREGQTVLKETEVEEGGEREGRERIGFEVSHERGKSVGMGEEER